MANVKFVLDADEAKAVKGFLKVVDSQRKAEKQFDRTNKKVDEQNKKSNKAAGDLGRMAASWLSVGAAIGGATKLLSAYNDMNAKGAELAKQNFLTMGQLSQLAGGDQRLMNRMVKLGQQTAAESGMSIGEGTQLQFNLKSLGIEDQREMLAALYGSTADVSALATGAVTAQTAFGKEETGNIRNLINKGLAASDVSKTLVDEMLTALSIVAPVMGGKAGIGATDEEALAALAILSKARKSPEVAATEMASLAFSLKEKGLGGKGLFKAMDAAQRELRGKTDKEQIEFFGRKEAFKGFQTLVAQQAQVTAALQQILASNNVVGPTDRVAGTIRTRRGRLSDTENNLRAERALEVAIMNRRSDKELRARTMITRTQTEGEVRGDPFVDIWSKKIAQEIVKFFGAGEGTVAGAAGGVESFQEIGTFTPGGYIGGLLEKIVFNTNKNNVQIPLRNGGLEK